MSDNCADPTAVSEVSLSSDDVKVADVTTGQNRVRRSTRARRQRCPTINSVDGSDSEEPVSRPRGPNVKLAVWREREGGGRSGGREREGGKGEGERGEAEIGDRGREKERGKRGGRGGGGGQEEGEIWREERGREGGSGGE